jgi:hypothetical protein
MQTLALSTSLLWYRLQAILSRMYANKTENVKANSTLKVSSNVVHILKAQGNLLWTGLPAGMQNGSCVSMPVAHLGHGIFTLELRAPAEMARNSCAFDDTDYVHLYMRFGSKYAVAGAAHQLGPHGKAQQLWNFPLREVLRTRMQIRNGCEPYSGYYYSKWMHA